jgi:ribonuclease P protein component
LTGASGRYPRTHRLLAATEYQNVFRSCRRKAANRYMSVLAIPNSLAHARLGTAVSIRSVGGAVRRNRIKRVIRESFRQHQELLSGWDVVVVVRPGIARQSNSRLFSVLENHWRTIADHAHTGPATD